MPLRLFLCCWSQFIDRLGFQASFHRGTAKCTSRGNQFQFAKHEEMWRSERAKESQLRLSSQAASINESGTKRQSGKKFAPISFSSFIEISNQIMIGYESLVIQSYDVSRLAFAIASRGSRPELGRSYVACERRVHKLCSRSFLQLKGSACHRFQSPIE